MFLNTVIHNELNPHNKVYFFDDWIISKEERIGKDIDSGGQNCTSYAQIKKTIQQSFANSVLSFFIFSNLLTNAVSVLFEFTFLLL